MEDFILMENKKISSSGTPNLEEAIPILEKWFDDVQNQKQKELKKFRRNNLQLKKQTF